MKGLTKDTQPEREPGSETAQSVVDFGSALTKTPHGAVYCMTIIGQIEGHTAAASGTKTTKYEHMLPLLVKLEESREVDGVVFLLNTVGGDVEAGLAIAELIAGMTKPTVSIVLGGSHSIGVPLAVAARRSFAVPSAAIDHPPRPHERHGGSRRRRHKLFPAPPGPHRGVRGRTQPHPGGDVPVADAAKGGHGGRCGERDLRRGGCPAGGRSMRWGAWQTDLPACTARSTRGKTRKKRSEDKSSRGAAALFAAERQRIQDIPAPIC